MTEVEFELRKLMVKYSPLFDQHQWAVESMRWIELAFALVSRISERPETDVRNIIEAMNLVGLLEIKTLAGLASPGAAIDFESATASRLHQYLIKGGFQPDVMDGFQPEEARKVIVALHEAAAAIERYFDGKIQRYLRKYGELMLHEMPEYFRFSQLTPEAARSAFSYWLQNVLAMPVPLGTPAVRSFCVRLGISEDQFINEVDAVDLNLALADDMVDLEEANAPAAR